MMNAELALKPMHKIDVVVHVDESLEGEKRSEVEKEVLQQEGVVCVNFNRRRTHLLLVGYDANLTTSAEIVSRLSQSNIRAELVGGL